VPNKVTVVPITSPDLDALEVSWFAPLCSDDYRHLGVPEGDLRSSWENTSDILQTADKLGYRNILCPSSYQVGQDTLSFVAANAPLTQNINMLAAVRCGEMQPIGQHHFIRFSRSKRRQYLSLSTLTRSR